MSKTGVNLEVLSSTNKLHLSPYSIDFYLVFSVINLALIFSNIMYLKRGRVAGNPTLWGLMLQIRVTCKGRDISTTCFPSSISSLAIALTQISTSAVTLRRLTIREQM